MKRILILLFLLLGLGAIAYFLKPSGEGEVSSISSKDRNFAFPEEEMGKITIQKVGEPEQVFDKRKGGVWFINGKYKVSQFTMPQITKTLSRITIQNIPSKSESKMMLKSIEKSGLQIKIYDTKGELQRSYKVGQESIDESGTAFLMDGASQPYNMYLKGFEGEIRTKLLQGVDEWRDRELFQYKPNQISEISIKYHKDEKSSFRLTKSGNSYDVKPLSQFMKPSSRKINKEKLNAYLGEYMRIYAEDFDNQNVRRDSISDLVPWATVSVKTNNGQINSIDFFPFRDLLLKTANTVELEEANLIERFFANKNDEDFLVTQMKILRRIFIGYDYFLE